METFSQVRDLSSCPPPPSMLGFYLVWDHSGLVHTATSRSKSGANWIGWVFDRKKNTASWVGREGKVSNLGGAGNEYDQNTLSEDLKELTKNSPFMISHSPLHHLYIYWRTLPGTLKKSSGLHSLAHLQGNGKQCQSRTLATLWLQTHINFCLCLFFYIWIPPISC